MSTGTRAQRTETPCAKAPPEPRAVGAGPVVSGPGTGPDPVHHEPPQFLGRGTGVEVAPRAADRRREGVEHDHLENDAHNRTAGEIPAHDARLRGPQKYVFEQRHQRGEGPGRFFG